MVNTHTRPLVKKVVSGGQTGVDRAALDVAIACQIPHGGWCPRGRLAEDGIIPAQYGLQENDSTEYWIRTEQNVVDSDGTLILFRRQLTGGTAFTHRMAVKHRRPFLLVDLSQPADPTAVGQWISQHGIEVLNVAGPRESTARGIGQQARQYLLQVLQG